MYIHYLLFLFVPSTSKTDFSYVSSYLIRSKNRVLLHYTHTLSAFLKHIKSICVRAQCLMCLHSISLILGQVHGSVQSLQRVVLQA